MSNNFDDVYVLSVPFTPATLSHDCSNWVNRDEREGTWCRIGVILRERGAIVEIVAILTKFKSYLNLDTITPTGD